MAASEPLPTRAPVRPPALPHAARGTPSADPRLIEELDTLIARGRKADGQFGARIQLLFMACQQARLPVPGVSELPMTHDLPPGSAAMTGYLVAQLPSSPRLAQAVRVAIFRYRELLDQLDRADEARAAGKVAPLLLEQLRQKLFFLGHYYEDFQSDAVLKALFPAPRVVDRAKAPAAGQPSPTRSPDDPHEVREAAIARGRTLLAALGPGMARIARVLTMVDGGPTLKLTDLFTPDARETRMLALTLPSNPDALAMLREAHQRWTRLGQALAALEKGGTAEAVRQLGEGLAELPLACRQNPLLRDLFPAAERGTREPRRAAG